MEIKGVKIGDKFLSKNIKCEVVDFHELKSLVTGNIIGYSCIAMGYKTLSTNIFEVPFSTVIRFKI